MGIWEQAKESARRTLEGANNAKKNKLKKSNPLVTDDLRINIFEFYFSKNYKEAITLFDKLFEITSSKKNNQISYTNDYLYRGLCDYFTNNYKEAIPFFDKAIELNDKPKNIIENNQHLYLSKSWKTITRLESYNFEHDFSDTKEQFCTFYRGMCDYQLGNYVQALNFFQKRCLPFEYKI